MMFSLLTLTKTRQPNPPFSCANRDVNEVCFGDTMFLTSGRMEPYILKLLAFVSYLNK